MAIPSKVTGAGNTSVATNVFRVTFSEATSDAPLLKAWDDANLNTILNEVFVGTAVNTNLPMINAVATTNSAPSSSWKPAGVTAGGAVINKLKGNTNYVNLHTGALTGGQEVKWNMCWEVPSDATVPQTGTNTMDAVILLEFTSAGTPPVLTWEFNDSSAGGTEGTPVWQAFTAGASGDFIIPTDAGVVAPNLVLHKPASSTLDAPEVWVSST